MGRAMTLIFPTILTLLAATAMGASASPAEDRAALDRILRAFLAATDARATHERFWADDLIYTSSSGARYGKAEILAGFDEPRENDGGAPVYGAEDVTIRLAGDIAVVTFRLTADENGERSAEFYNTGVFRRDADGWRAFTWQATGIPGVAP